MAEIHDVSQNIERVLEVNARIDTDHEPGQLRELRELLSERSTGQPLDEFLASQSTDEIERVTQLLVELRAVVNNPYLEQARESLNSCNNYEARDNSVRQFAWAIPNEEALEAIARNIPASGIVEIGAGQGYWGYCLAQKGIDVLCYDQETPSKGWFEVSAGSVEKAAEHSDRALLLCWPPYDEPMAADCLSQYSGDVLVYVGEGYGGCTGDDRFHDMLSAEWKEVEHVCIPQWSGIHDYLTIYRRQ